MVEFNSRVYLCIYVWLNIPAKIIWSYAFRPDPREISKKLQYYKSEI